MVVPTKIEKMNVRTVVLLCLLVVSCLADEDGGSRPYLVTPCSVVKAVYFWNFPLPAGTYEITFDYRTSNSSQLPSQLIFMDFTSLSIWQWDEILLELANVRVFVEKNGGVVGGLILKDYGTSPGYTGWRKWQNVPEDYNISVALIGYFDVKVWNDHQCSVNITYPPLHNITNSNLWRQYLENGAILSYCIISSLLFFSNTFFASFRLRTIIVISLELSLSVICLSVEILGNILYAIKYVILAVDYYSPTFSRPRATYADLMVTLTVPFLLVSSILFLFFWIDVTSTASYLYKGRFLYATKVPAIITIVLIFALEIILDIIRFTFPSIGGAVTLYVSLIYALVLCLLCFFNIYILCIARKHLSSSVLSKKQSKRLIMRVTVNIVILFLAICISATTFATGHMPGTDLFTNSVVSLVAWAHSFNQILVYGGTKKKAKTSKSTSQTSDPSNNVTL